MSNFILLITQIVTLIGVVGTAMTAWYNNKKINEIHISINSRMDQLLKLTGTSERAAGAKEERDRKGT